VRRATAALLVVALALSTLLVACMPEGAVSSAAVSQALDEARQAHRLKAQKRYADALPFIERAYPVLDAASRDGAKVDRLSVLSDYLQLLDYNHRYAALLAAARHESGQRMFPGGTDPGWQELLANAEAAALQALGRRHEAIEGYRRAIEIVKQADGPEDRSIATYLLYIAETQLDMNELEGAKASLAQAAQLLDPPDFHSRTSIELVELMARLSVATGRTDLALTLARRAVDYGEAMRRPPDDQAVTVMELAQVQFARGQYVEAVALLRRALPVLQEHLGEAHPLCARGMEWLASALAAAGQREEALRLMQRSTELADEVLGPQHPDTVQRRQRLVALQRQARALAAPPAVPG
jgi:tetratricopeptide (TPR) repeat protein